MSSRLLRTSTAGLRLFVVVSNELGMGVVPTTQLGRSFRDLLGRVNTEFAARAERACLVVAGRALELT
jgi:adenosylcobinamide kinase/adenosylcobinamide-phosphate guanylyltransferase